HACRLKSPLPELCPKCQSWRIKTVGAGTQRVEAEAKKSFPKTSIFRLDSDATPRFQDQEKIIRAFNQDSPSILVATQAILGWKDALKPALIGILAIDSLFNLPDFHAGERTWQTIFFFDRLLYKSGQLLIQTYNPENHLLQSMAKNDFLNFSREELLDRQNLDYPPFSQIIKLSFRLRDPQRAEREAKILAAKLQQANKDDTISISSATPAWRPKEKGFFIWQIIIKQKIADNNSKISPAFLARRNQLLQYVPSSWHVEVDPENLL
ncbi:MAG: hypothetical protein AAB724_00965, partial [Patescibacteria group bacterium]